MYRGLAFIRQDGEETAVTCRFREFVSPGLLDHGLWQGSFDESVTEPFRNGEAMLLMPSGRETVIEIWDEYEDGWRSFVADGLPPV